jgi:ornithine decarboxylase antizyme
VLDAQNDTSNNAMYRRHGHLGYLSDIDGEHMLDDSGRRELSSSTASGETLTTAPGLVKSYLELWDYRGGCRFRGFVAERDGEETALFVFFDDGAFGHGLKPGYVYTLRDQIIDLTLPV